MSILPPEFQTDNLDALTTAARDHLARVKGNRAVQKKQKDLVKQRSNRNSNPPPTSSPPPVTPVTNPGNNPARRPPPCAQAAPR